MFDVVDRLYATADRALTSGLKVFEVDCSALRQLTGAIKNFDVLIKQREITGGWEGLLSFIKRVNFLVSSTSLAPYHVLDQMRSEAESFSNSAARAYATADAEVKSRFDSLKSALAVARRSLTTNPLWEAFTDGVCDKNTGFLSLDARIAPRYLQFLSDQRHQFGLTKSFSLVNPAELRDISYFDRIVIFGSPWWLECRGQTHVLTSPRAPEVMIFSFSHYSVQLPPISRLERHAAEAETAIRSVLVHIPDKSPVAEPAVYPFTKAELTTTALPVVNISAIMRTPEEGQERGETEEAQIVLLSAGKAVFLPTEGKCWSIVTEQKDSLFQCTDIRKSSVSTLETADVILLSTSGAGDLVVPYADEILGADKDHCRELQKEWKLRLSEKIERVGRQAVLKALLDFGSSDANETNLRNWCRINPRSIAPYYDSSFLAILKLVGLDERSQDFLNVVGKLRRAHLQAGKSMTREIRLGAIGASLSELYNSGQQEFELRGSTAGAKQSAFFVEQLDATVYLIPWNRIGVVFEVGEDLWR
jgi:hypothetical protein